MAFLTAEHSVSSGDQKSLGTVKRDKSYDGRNGDEMGRWDSPCSQVIY